MRFAALALLLLAGCGSIDPLAGDGPGDLFGPEVLLPTSASASSAYASTSSSGGGAGGAGGGSATSSSGAGASSSVGSASVASTSASSSGCSYMPPDGCSVDPQLTALCMKNGLGVGVDCEPGGGGPAAGCLLEAPNGYCCPGSC